MNAKSGDVLWQERVGGEFFGSPVAAVYPTMDKGARLYAMSRAGELVVLSASSTFEVLGRVDLGEPSFATPAIADGVLYLRTRTYLTAVGGD